MTKDLSNINDIPLFFIIGRPRSGTTLLRTLLDAHPNVIVPTECPFILHLAKRYENVKNWDHNTINRFLEDLKRMWLFPITGIDIELLRNDLYSISGIIDYLTICKVVLLNYPKVFDKKDILLIGDKNPGYSVTFPYLYRIINNKAKYILLTRDYRDQFLSLNQTNYDFPYIAIPTKRWRQSIIDFTRISKRQPELFHTMRYEDLVVSPEKELKKVTDFLSIDFDPHVLKFHEHKEDFLKIFPERVLKGDHKNLLYPIKPDKIGIWKQKLKPIQVKIADTIAGQYADKFNYERVYKRFNLFYGIYALPGLMFYFLLKFGYMILRLMPFRIYIRFSRRSVMAYIWNKYILRREYKSI
ncbi:MAG: sulfotransferase [Bacteroidales bacterium]|jgi:hypothetical protein